MWPGSRKPLAVISRGYSAAFDSEGKLITKADQLSRGKRFALRVSDGTVNAVSEGKIEE